MLQWASTALEEVALRLLCRLADSTLAEDGRGVAEDGRGVHDVSSDSLSTVLDEDISWRENNSSIKLIDNSQLLIF